MYPLHKTVKLLYLIFVVVDDVRFYVEHFTEFIDPAVAGLFRILAASEDPDTKLRILSVVSIIFALWYIMAN